MTGQSCGGDRYRKASQKKKENKKANWDIVRKPLQVYLIQLPIILLTYYTYNYDRPDWWDAWQDSHTYSHTQTLRAWCSPYDIAPDRVKYTPLTYRHECQTSCYWLTKDYEYIWKI